MDSSSIDGLSDKTIKFPLKSTYGFINFLKSFNFFFFKVDKANNLKGNCLRFKNVLNGQIKYEFSNRFLDSFKGFLKLKKDPKAEYFNISNVVLRNSILHYSRW